MLECPLLAFNKYRDGAEECCNGMSGVRVKPEARDNDAIDPLRHGRSRFFAVQIDRFTQDKQTVTRTSDLSVDDPHNRYWPPATSSA
jgi:hypothetical protein